MPQFRFTVVDASGQTKRGTIEASTESEAVSRIAKRGLTITSILPVAPDTLIPSTDNFRQTNRGSTPTPIDLGEEPYPPHRPTQTAPRYLTGLVWLSFIASSLSMIFVSALAAYVFIRDPLGKGLGSYDFSTPEAATKSTLLMESNQDIRAELDLARLRKGAISKDAVRTLDITRVADAGDRKIVFASYLEKGNKRKKVFSFEKDLETKIWVPTFMSSYDVKKTNEQLAKDMQAWEDKLLD